MLAAAEFEAAGAGSHSFAVGARAPPVVPGPSARTWRGCAGDLHAWQQRIGISLIRVGQEIEVCGDAGWPFDEFEVATGLIDLHPTKTSVHLAYDSVY